MTEKVKYDVVPRDDQETVISYQNWDGEWKFYSNCPKHIRKWAERVTPDVQGVDERGRVLMLKGTITQSTVQIVKQRVLSAGDREAAAVRLKEARNAQY